MKSIVSVLVVFSVSILFLFFGLDSKGIQKPVHPDSAFLTLPFSGFSLRSLNPEPRPSRQDRPAAAANASREDRIAFIKKTAVPVRTIEAEDTNFADLEPLRRVIGSRRIVMLGEISHGDGATLKAKVRLIKFLHEQMGFDLIAFESGFYDLHKAWSVIREGGDPLPAIRSSVFPIWSRTSQVEPLWRYVIERLKTDRPLELAGFDMQFTGGLSNDHLVKDLNDYLNKTGVLPEAAEAAARVSEALTLLMQNKEKDSGPFKKIKPDDRVLALKAADMLIEALGRIRPAPGPGAAERDFWTQLLKSSATMLEYAWRMNYGALRSGTMDWGVLNLRDRQMAENFIWLAKQVYPARKIIAWAATSHIVRNRASFMNANDPMIAMGEWIDKTMGPEVYTLGFTAYRGQHKNISSSRTVILTAAARDSLEDLFFETGLEFAWLDFRNLSAEGIWLREPLSSRPLGFSPMTADWTRIMDGMFFIREMSESTRFE